MFDSCPGVTMLNASNDEFMLLAVEEEEESLAQVKRRFWVRPAWRARKTEGEFCTLYKSLLTDGDKFFEYFRMPEYSFNELLQKLKVHLTKKDTFWRRAITAQERLAVALRFLATGDAFNTISFSYRMGTSTVESIVHETCDIIRTFLMPEVMVMPTEERWKVIAQNFENLWNFPNCIGALDGKHVAIRAPAKSGSLYYNYKKFYSIVLLALVDAHCNFIAVDVGAYGRSSDGGIFANSKLGKGLLLQSLNVPAPSTISGTDVVLPYVIVADEAFPLKVYIMRPFPGEELDSGKRQFNYRLSRARRTVENAFGMLSQKFRILDRRINASPQNVDNIVLTACTLHNFVRKTHNVQYGHCDEGNVNCTIDARATSEEETDHSTSDAFCVRDTFKTYFCSNIGRLAWLPSSDNVQQ